MVRAYSDYGPLLVILWGESNMVSVALVPLLFFFFN